MKPIQILPALIALALAAACAAPSPYAENEKRLGANLAQIEAGQLASAGRDLEAMLAQTQPLASELRLQRFYASVLLTEVHTRASLGAPFIRDIERSSAPGIGGVEDKAGSQTAHIVAIALYANVGKDLAAKAKGAALRADGIELLPEKLRGLAPAAAESKLDLSLLVVFSRLGFDDRVAKMLDASPGLYKLEDCEKLIEDARIDAAERPWIYLAMFKYLRAHDEPAAYKFGVRLLATAAGSKGTISAAQSEAVIEWIRNGSKFAFRCPSCNQPVVPELSSCQNDQTSHLSFYAEPRKP